MTSWNRPIFVLTLTLVVCIRYSHCTSFRYVSYFRDFAELEARRHEAVHWEQSVFHERSFAFGPGVESGGQVGTPVQFTIEARNAADRRVSLRTDDVSVEITSPNAFLVPITIEANEAVVVKYTPIEVGNYEISIKLQDKPIKNSPMMVSWV